METGDGGGSVAAGGSGEPDPGLVRWRVVSPIVIAGDTYRAGTIVHLPADSPRVRAGHVLAADDENDPSPEIVAALEAAQAEGARS